MRKFVLNKDRKKLTPSDEQIKKQKDFARLHHEYERLTKRSGRPLYKDPKLFMLLLIIGIILLLIFLGEIWSPLTACRAHEFFVTSCNIQSIENCLRRHMDSIFLF